MDFLPFFHASNLTDKTLVEGQPWDFIVDPEQNPLKKIPKDKRRAAMLKPGTKWNVYTAIKAYVPGARVSKTNPPQALHGAVADYDMKSDIDTVMKYIGQQPAQYQPTFIEISLGDKIRLVWIFERPVLTPSPGFCEEFLIKFFEKVGAPILLPGFDKRSTEASEMWTNGATWYEVKSTPVPWDVLFGIACGVSKKAALFNNGEVPLEILAEEVEKKFPGRWKGKFELDAQGVRFWDAQADNETGAQVKPDGMLCFTGNEPFVKWEQIFGRAWVEEQKILNLGRAGQNIYFDGKSYWEQFGKRWESVNRTDIILRLKGRGLSDRCPKNQTQSDAERVLDHIQQINRVVGAAPLINYEPGLVSLQGRRILNTVDLQPVQPVKGTGKPVKDFPWLWKFLNGFFARAEDKPFDHCMAWLQRAYRVVYLKERLMGQAIFICGPRNNGKTLFCLRVVAPLLGNRVANPMDFIVGDTTFNDELFDSALLAVNDEDSPNGDTARKRMMARLKGLVVNPLHKYSAKFEKPVTIEWNGRLVITLNDDPGSVGMLTDVEHNTRDKWMFFASQPYSGKFPPQVELEATLARELPFFAHWLLYEYKAPDFVLWDNRMGVKSYFDRRILELSNHQTFASNLSELLAVWMHTDAFWADNPTWEGTPTALLTALQTCSDTSGVMREWTQAKIARSLTSLAKQDDSNVNFLGDNGREFQIKKP